MHYDKSGARDRINKSKGLSLDERVAVLREILAEQNITVEQLLADRRLASRDQAILRVADALLERGLEPMMFSHASRILLSLVKPEVLEL